MVVNFITTKILDFKIKIMNAKVKEVKKTKGKNINDTIAIIDIIRMTFRRTLITMKVRIISKKTD